MHGEPMPAVFVGHGNPMHAIDDNTWTRQWKALGASLPRPRAILVISAHWYVPGTRVTAQERPPTIHDFGAFPQALFDVQYPAPGDAELVERVRALLAPQTVVADATSWGIDHGAWSVLVHLFPDADVPVVQLSINESLTPEQHFALAQKLAPLRDEGVLIVGSGNIVHNLAQGKWREHDGPPHPWAQRFDDRIRDAITAGDDRTVVHYAELPDAAIAAPDEDHFYPLLYVLATRRPNDKVSFPVEGIDMGAFSMRSVMLSAKA